MPKLKLHDQRMILLMEFIVKDKSYKAINSESKFLKSIGLAHMNNFYAIKRGERSFSLEHLIKAIEIYKVDSNFLFYKMCPLSFNVKNKTAIDLLNAAILLISK